ncbi:MAG TPA: archease [Candidatus Eisenbacteria bacterium]|jgi:predicted phosphoribosyltransferase/SHS2 domain-containing protein
MVFRNREHAAQLLAKRLAKYRGRHPLVLGIPRGAVPMAAIIAEALEGDLDVALVHKLGAPFQSELAIGAVDEEGHVSLSETAGQLGIDAEYITRERDAQIAMLRERRARYTPARPRVSPEGRIVMIVDDGIATGSTLLAALRATRARGPARLIAVAAVAPVETVQKLKREADEVVVLHAPIHFLAVGEFFQDFRQVPDEEVIEVLGGCGRKPAWRSEAEPSDARWELFAHQADIGVRGIGPTRERAFEQAALALTAVVVDPQRVGDGEAVALRCEAPDDELLFVDWLNAIVYEMSTRKMLFGRYQARIAGRRLHGTAWGERVDVGRHQPAVEIKGASMTELRVGRREDGSWVAQCVVDV